MSSGERETDPQEAAHVLTGSEARVHTKLLLWGPGRRERMGMAQMRKCFGPNAGGVLGPAGAGSRDLIIKFLKNFSGRLMVCW